MKCKNCSVEFVPNPRAIVVKFCSKKCRERSWRKNNRQKLNENVRNYRKRRYQNEGRWRENGPKVIALRNWMLEIKSQPCTDCGNTFPICCMDFDHKEGTIKQYNVGSMFAHHYSRELIEKELLKCVLVCSNCHRIRTQKRRIGSGKYRIQTV